MKDGAISVIYFMGVALLGTAIGSYTHIPEYAFMIIGSGAILYSGIVAIIMYLHKEE